MSDPTRKPKHVSFEFPPVSAEEAESEGTPLPPSVPDLWEFTTVEKKRLAEMEIAICNLRADRDSEQRWAREYFDKWQGALEQIEALEAENHRLRDQLMTANAANCEEERHIQQLELDILALKMALMQYHAEREA